MAEHGLPEVWGATEAEVTATYPCDRFATPGSTRVFRAVDVAADRETTWAWVCQVRRAPYSYDVIDNFGRRSPRTLDPTMTDLALGQTFSTYFTIIHFADGESLTVAPRPGRPAQLFGGLVFTYAVAASPDGGTRLICVLQVPPSRGVLAQTRQNLLVWGDLVMMRKQLKTLSGLAARTPRP